MEAQELREKLTEYILYADEEKLEALHTLLITEQEETEYQWWKDEKFVAELKEEEQKIKSGEIKGYTEEEANASFRARIEKRKLEHA